MRKQTSRNKSLKRDSGSGDLERTQLSSTRASRASWHATAPWWLHWECRRAGSSLGAGMEALGMAPCGAGPAAAASPWLRHSEPSVPVGGPRRMGDPSQPGPLAAPRISTGNVQSPHGQPSARARAQRWPSLSLGNKGGAEQGSTSRVLVPPARGSGAAQERRCAWGTRADLPSGAGAIRTHPNPGI